jgi:hypothetical protein
VSDRLSAYFLRLQNNVSKSYPSETACDKTGCFLLKINTGKAFRRQAENIVIGDNRERQMNKGKPVVKETGTPENFL